MGSDAKLSTEALGEKGARCVIFCLIGFWSPSCFQSKLAPKKKSPEVLAAEAAAAAEAARIEAERLAEEARIAAEKKAAEEAALRAKLRREEVERLSTEAPEVLAARAKIAGQLAAEVTHEGEFAVCFEAADLLIHGSASAYVGAGLHLATPRRPDPACRRPLLPLPIAAALSFRTAAPNCYERPIVLHILTASSPLPSPLSLSSSRRVVGAL